LNNGSTGLATWVLYNGAQKDTLTGLAWATSRTTRDGSIFVFQSRARLTSYNNAGNSEIYRYDAANIHLSCISCSPVGAAPVGNAFLQGLNGPTDALTPVANLTDDGSVFFESPDRLVPGDVNSPCPKNLRTFSWDCTDVYEWKRGILSLISSGR